MIAKLRALPTLGVIVVQILVLSLSAVPGSAQAGQEQLARGANPVQASQAAQPQGSTPNWVNSPHTIMLPLIMNSKPDSGVSAGGPINMQMNHSSIAVYDKFEAQFDVPTTAENPDLPYDPNPPPGVKPGLGVTVDVLFSSNNWQSMITQPAFLYQPYDKQTIGGQDHLTPAGRAHWMVRYTPQSDGTWQFRVRVQDKNGTAYYPAQNQPAYSFTASGQSSNPYLRKGFVKVSQADSRYFQFSDGEPFVGAGYNDSFDTMAGTEQKMQSYEQNKMNFMRVWMSGSGMNGSQWTPWSSHSLPGDGYLPGVNFDTNTTYNGSDVSMRLDDRSPCFFTGYTQGPVPIEPNTHYQIQARVKLSGVSGDGFVIKYGSWLGTDCSKSGVGASLSQPVRGDTGWITVDGSYTSSSGQYWLDKLYLVRQNSGGVVYIDDIRMWKADDPNKVNILRQPNANSHMYFDPMNAARWDSFIQSAEQHGVYLKLVIDEKNEWIRNHIGADGKMTSQGSNDNFYAKPGTKVRWLEQAWWRYLLARWGYSPAVQTFEYVNEGDPYDGNHYEAANSMAKYFHQNDPNRHMVTTSFWASFPNAEFWSNPNYPDIDYADLHAYIATGWGLTASLLPSSQRETNPAYIHSGNGSARIMATDSFHEDLSPRSLVIKGAGNWTVQYWMMAQNFTATCGTGGEQRIRWYVDGSRQGVVPAGPGGNDYGCTSPGGSYGWTKFTGTISIGDNNPHALILALENSNGTGGTAWIDDLVVISPSGEVAHVLGEFDYTPMDADTAWYNQAYGEVFGGSSPVGAHKPLVRGETGIDFVGNQDWNRDLSKDTQGIWLHNNVWGQINSGGMYDLFWWASETIKPGIYSNYLAFRNFMEGIPLNNGHYRDSGATTSDSRLRVMGQRDDTNGRIHLWVQNIVHTWKNVVNNVSIPQVGGSISIPNVPAGRYHVSWWDTYRTDTSRPVFSEYDVDINGTLSLSLPQAISTDVGVKIERIR